ncbi:unnamed protein product [Closterium sp. Naga37s-1]|nr:unnamed protein product [Closterium sp. Naga37s-1]
MGSMRASPAGLLLLAIALICAVPMMKAAHGDDTVRSMTHRTAHRSMLKESYGAGEEKNAEDSLAEPASSKVTARARVSFGSQRCVAVPKKARGKSAQVWWNGPGGSSSKAKGFACSQIKFFGKGGCHGRELDSMVNPGSTTAKFPSNKKTLSKWAPLASVLCTDAPCDALGCQPGGKCVVDENGERYCHWGE